MSDQETTLLNRESLDEYLARIGRNMENRVVLYCDECEEMQRYVHDLTWHCSECGGGDVSTSQLKEMVGP